MNEKKIVVDGITFTYDDLEITDEIMDQIHDFIDDLEGSPDEDYDTFYMYLDGGFLVIYWGDFFEEKNYIYFFSFNIFKPFNDRV